MVEIEKSSKIEIGKVIAAYGLRGQVKVRSFAENPEDIFKYSGLHDKSGHNLRIKSYKKSAVNIFTVFIEGVFDRNSAKKIVGESLYISKDSLPEIKPNEYYLKDLIGLEVRNPQGDILGRVESLQNYGAGDLVEISFITGGKTELFLLNQATFPEINIKSGHIILDPPEEIWVNES